MHVLVADRTVDRHPRLRYLDGEVLPQTGLAAPVRAPREPHHAGRAERGQAQRTVEHIALEQNDALNGNANSSIGFEFNSSNKLEKQIRVIQSIVGGTK